MAAETPLTVAPDPQLTAWFEDVIREALRDFPREKKIKILRRLQRRYRVHTPRR